jgi:hypothetical protein
MNLEEWYINPHALLETIKHKYGSFSCDNDYLNRQVLRENPSLNVIRNVYKTD